MQQRGLPVQNSFAAGSVSSTPIYPQRAAHPARFEQRLQQQTANVVTMQQTGMPSNASAEEKASQKHYAANKLSKDAIQIVSAPQASIAALAGQEFQRQKKQQFLNSGCVQSNALVTLNSTQANRMSKQNLRAAANLDSSLEYSVLLPSMATATLLSHQLAYAQLSSWESKLQCSGDLCSSENGILAINPLPVCGQDYYTLGVSELYNITCDRQNIALGQNISLQLPLTLAEIVSVAVFEMPAPMKSICNATHANEDDSVPVYWFKTATPHGFVPGLSFFFVAPLPPTKVTLNVTECEFLPRNAQRFIVIDTAHCQDACLSGSGGEHERCFLALRCNSDGAQQARVFAPFDDVEFRKYGSESPLIVIEPFDLHVSVQLVSLCNYNCCEKIPHQVFENKQAYAYVPPPTTPDQLTFLANGTARRAQLVCTSERLYTAFSNVSFKYDASIDQYLIKLDKTCTYERSLFGDACSVATSLNFPLTRSAMVATEVSPELQQEYLDRVLHDFFWFTVQCEFNDCFDVKFECGDQTLRHRIVVPAGVYAARHLAQIMQQSLNCSYITEKTNFCCDRNANALAYQFRVTYKLYSTEQLTRARADLDQGNSVLLPAASSTPYTSMTFCFFIEALDCTQLFSLDFSDCEQSQAFAKLIDFDPFYCYQLRSSYVGRALAPFYYGSDARARQCAEQIEKNAQTCAPCPRRTYGAQVTTPMAQRIVTLEQRIQRPFQVRKVSCNDAVGTDCCAGPLTVSLISLNEGKCDAAIQICAGDVLIASRTNPLCRIWCRENSNSCCLFDCTTDEVLVPILCECGAGRFVLTFDPFPAPLLQVCADEKVQNCAARLDESETFWLWSMPVGFNLHLHSAQPLQQASSVNYNDAEKSLLVPLAAQSTPVTRYLGFSTPQTRSNAYIYVSDCVPTSIIDQNILVVVPELAPAASSDNRHTLYANTSPFDRLLTQVYAQLVLDPDTKSYLAGPDILSKPLALCKEVCVSACVNGITPLSTMTIILLRPDGSPYYLNGGQYVFTFEMAFVQQ